MDNSPELDGKYLGTITKDFVLIANTLKEAAYQLTKREISKFPIFPISKADIEVGQLLIGKNEMALEWNYYFSFAEEFIQRGLIDPDKLDDFQNSVYKDPEEFCCLFVIDEDFLKFIILPYPDEDDSISE